MVLGVIVDPGSLDDVAPSAGITAAEDAVGAGDMLVADCNGATGGASAGSVAAADVDGADGSVGYI